MKVLHRYIHYLVWSYSSRYGRGLSRYKILALLFLADMRSLKERGSRLLSVEWYKLFRIPYSREVVNAIHDLTVHGYIKTRGESLLYLPVMRPIGISPETMKLIDSVVEEYGGMSIMDLYKVLAELAPVRKARLGERIELEA